MEHWVRLSQGRRRGGLHRVREAECCPFQTRWRPSRLRFRSAPFALLLGMLGIFSAEADATVSDVVTNQRWPWSEKVDVDFTLTGETTDVDVYATWDALRGAAAPGVASPVLLGTVFAATPGANRFTWDPNASPWAGRTLTGFSVTLAPSSSAAHTYLVVDLQNGGVSYRAEPDGTDGKWSDEYKSAKMVFRRIPAGTYTLGEAKSVFSCLGASSNDAETYYKICGTRTVTFTSDFYVGVFRYTTAQQSWLENGCADGDSCSAVCKYDALRGGLSTDGIDWPLTRYEVASTSVVARLRAKAGGAFTVDLCEDEQWEVAARAGAGTFWSSGGTTNETFAVLSNHVNAVAAWRGNGYSSGVLPVGQKEPNAWGLYDIIGAGTAEWVLDTSKYFNSNGTLPNSQKSGATLTDPVGGHGSKNLRIYRSHSGFGTSTKLLSLLPAMRRAADPATSAMGVRFCIHLKPLKFN